MMKTQQIENAVQMDHSHLISGCPAICKGSCNKGVKMAATGRFFITMGHPGFNSPANNRQGYKTLKAANQAICRYMRKGA